MTLATSEEANAIKELAAAIRHLASVVACARCKGAGRITYQGYSYGGGDKSEQCPVCKGKGS